MKTNTKRLAETAILLAAATVLSMIKFDMPMGGGVTICSMLPLILLSFRYGWKWGLFSSFVYSLLQLLLGLDNVQYASSAIMAAGIIFLDYIIAYTVIGLASLLCLKPVKSLRAVITGIIFTFFIRFICHFITGVWIWDALWPNELGMTSVVYSAAYNGWYMAAETVLSIVVVCILYSPLKKYFYGEDLK